MIKISPYKISFKNKLARVIWFLFWAVAFRPTPVLMHRWRRAVLIIFGAKISKEVHVYPSASIWAPWNLTMCEGSCLSHGVICYNVAPVHVGKNATVSQYSNLCTATHDYTDPSMPLMVASIYIEDNAWITADVFVGPGVTIGEGAVINSRSTVFSDIEPWTVAKGYQARSYKKRLLKGMKE